MLPRPRFLALLPVLVSFAAVEAPAFAQDTQPTGTGDSAPATSPAAPADPTEPAPPPKKPAPKKKPAAKKKPASPPKKEEPKKEEPKKEEGKPSAASTELAGEPGARERGFQFSFGAGFTRQDVGAFSSSSLAFDKTGANGVLLEMGLGVRFGQIRGGMRLRANDTTEFTIWQAMVEGGYGFEIKNFPIVPVALAHVGYAFKRDLEDAVIRSQLPSGTAIPPKFGLNGLVVGVEVAGDYHASSYLHVQPFITGDLLFMARGRAAVPRTVFGNPTPEEAGRPLYTDSGSGIGYGFNAGIRGIFDVGF